MRDRLTDQPTVGHKGSWESYISNNQKSYNILSLIDRIKIFKQQAVAKESIAIDMRK